MFAIAIFFGVYSNLIFILGILGILYKPLVIIITLISFFAFLKYLKTEGISFELPKLDKLSKLVILLIMIQAFVNLIGVLGPEISFDALWYHLTLPKIFLDYHKIFHIPGGLFYYSDMPKLGETLYIGALSFGNEIVAKFVHYIFGILCLFSIYGVANKFINKKLALVACLIFYSNLVVGWESITAYIDLTRTFFEITAFWAFMEWVEKKDNKLLYESAVILGLAISTKLIAIGSIIVFATLITYYFKSNKNLIIKSIFKYFMISFFVASPWFVFSYLNTGNPFYPLFTQYYSDGININLLNPFNFISATINVLLRSSDPISPIYIILFPMAIFIYKKLNGKNIYLVIYAFVSIIVWYLTPQTGGGRFLLPYLPVLSILSVVIINQMKNNKKLFISLVILISITSIGYRAVANFKFMPVLLGFETKKDFLTKKLNFSYGDFYDVDNFFKNNIGKNDKVLLYGFHNLYYVDFPFIDSSYVKTGDTFNYIAVQNSVIPKRFSFMTLIYSNSVTKVNVYSAGGQTWHY